MTSDRGSREFSIMDVDLDDIEVEVLIIARNPKLLSAAATFLSRRGWPTSVTSNVSQAIELIAERKPDFVLISLNHTSPALVRLPDLVENTFSSTCIAFTEVMDTASTARLNKSRMSQKVMGQASGPNLHRFIRRILAEKLNLQIDEARAQEAIQQLQNASANISKGDGNDFDSGPTLIQRGVAGTKFNTKAQGPQGSMPGTISSDKEVLSTGKYTMTKKNRRSLKDLMAKPGEMPASSDVAAPSADASAPPELTAQKSKTDELLARLKASLFPEGSEDLEQEAPVSLLEKTIESAISEVCDGEAGEIGGVLSMVRRVGVFPVHSPVSPGYLVIASSMDQRRSDEFFRSAEVVLQKAFTAMGVPGFIESGFSIEVPEVEFGRWASEKATFTIVLGHQGYEVGAAFFETTKPLPKVKPTENSEMLSVEVEDIATNRPVNFKAYLHMKKNNKYYLYLRNGRKFQPEQKDRLQSSQVKDFYMKSVDKDNIRAFLATAFLAQSIEEVKDEAA